MSAVATEGPGGVVTTGSKSSTVELDYDCGTAHKTYEPPFWVRALYRLAFRRRSPTHRIMPLWRRPASAAAS